MNQPVQTKFEELDIIDVRITDAASLPAEYFFRQPVIEALQREVRRDVLSHHKPVPAGAQPIMGKRSFRPASLLKQPKINAKRPFTRRAIAATALIVLILVVVIVRSF